MPGRGLGTSAPPLRARVPAGAVPDAEGLCSVLQEFGGNVARVASYSVSDRKQIYRWAERLRVERDEGRSAGSDADGRD